MQKPLLRNVRLLLVAPHVIGGRMISVIIPTRDAEKDLAPTLAALIPAAIDGFVREVIVADGSSSDRTLTIAENAGVEVVETAPGRGRQLRAGANRARFPWLLFIHADTELAPGWETVAANFMHKVDSGRIPPAAAAFRFRLFDEGWKPRLLEAAVAVRCGLFRMPYGDQGLLIPRTLYNEVGGFSEQPLMEDVDLVRRIGRRRLTMLRADAITSAVRYRSEGYARRIVRNQTCLAMYAAGFAPERIATIYEPKHARGTAIETCERLSQP
jgi:rSAM/selenodomain-associated transferase 2